MNDFSEEKALFRRALVEARLRNAKELISSYEGDVVYSEHHNRVMKKMLTSADKPYFPFGKKKVRRIVAVLVAAALLLLGGMTVYANREKIVSFVKEVFDGYITVFFQTDDDAGLHGTVEQKYTLTYIPEGYECTGEDIDDTGVWMMWTNDKEERVVFTQMPLDALHNIDNEHSTSEWIKIGERDVYRTNDSYGYSYYIWTDDVYSFKIDCPSDMSLGEVQKMIDSIALIE